MGVNIPYMGMSISTERLPRLSTSKINKLEEEGREEERRREGGRREGGRERGGREGGGGREGRVKSNDIKFTNTCTCM